MLKGYELGAEDYVTKPFPMSVFQKKLSDVLGLLKTTSQKFHQTLVMITHNSEIAQLADRIIRIEDGKIVQ